QIQDDLLDITGNEKELGKPIDSDARNHKINYITLNGIEKSIMDMNSLFEQAITNLNGINSDSSRFLKSILLFIKNRKS
nr:polyprenyl synthetase family protein [Vallitaleaceae bacterium]